MLISKLIKQLENIYNKYGDVKVAGTIYDYQIKRFAEEYNKKDGKLNRYYTVDIKLMDYDEDDNEAYFNL